MQAWLGHGSAAFTMADYVHLLDDEVPTVEWDTPRVHVVSTPHPELATAAANSG